MEKVLSFCPKSTIVLPKKYYRFLGEDLSRCNRLTCQLIEEAWLFR